MSGRALAWDHHRLTGESLSPVEIGERARANDPRADATFARYEDRLARALAGVINLVDPRVIVLGGGISNNLRLFENVPRLWERYTSLARWRPGWCAPSTATPAGSAAPPGCGLSRHL